MMDAANIETVICQEGLEDKLRQIAGPNLKIVTRHAAREAGRPALEIRHPDAEDLAYVIFTSGSTGRPKGVMIRHRNIASQMAWFHDSHDLGRDTTILQKTPFSFDAAQWELLASAFGACLVFGTPAGYRNPFEQIRLIQDFGVTMLQCVPTLWRALLETERLGDCRTLTRLFSGGEALSRELARDCLAALPHAQLVNLYGPTECTINATSFTVTQAWLDNGQNTVPIGRPVDGTDILILNDDGQPVPAGETGEIHIGGRQVGQGYLNDDRMTAERFITRGAGATYYKSGDVGLQNPDGTIQFLSRTDGQIKLRGYRIEIDEIRTAIENHEWVKAAGVFVDNGGGAGNEALVACVELSPNQAQLMDSSAAGDHHRSKSNKLQVKAQLSGLGMRQPEELSSSARIALPGKTPTEDQEALAFARKSYRHFEGGDPVRPDEIAALLTDTAPAPDGSDPCDLSLAELGTMLRNFGAFSSRERLLPKFAYASPGALYATQIYLEIAGSAAMPGGLYYLHPAEHALYRIAGAAQPGERRFRLHFIGKSRAIASVYKLNLREVLDFEAGHILGLFDRVLADHGLAIGMPCDDRSVLAAAGGAPDDFYLGGFDVTGRADAVWQGPAVVPYLQMHEDTDGAGQGGMCALHDGQWRQAADGRIERSHLIAINQRVYDRSAFGLALCTPGTESSQAFVALGRALQRLQMNDRRIGFMSSGYSSASGEDQRAATRFFDLMGERSGAVYFCVGGRVSASQVAHRGMKEDAVHSKGPLELIQDDLRARLPAFMVPNHVTLVDKLPLSANGKLDMKKVRELFDRSRLPANDNAVAPRNGIEREIAHHWAKITKGQRVSVTETFFDAGGDSLGAVKLVMRLNETFGIDLPLETIFQAATIEALAECIAENRQGRNGRLVPLAAGSGTPVFCWPGLGGYPMSLKGLADQISAEGRPVLGVQAHGLNKGESPDTSVADMARRDLAEIRKSQPVGPYTLIGYSFGARIAFETAIQLEAAGETVENLILIAPGSPTLHHDGRRMDPRASFDNPDHVAVLLSVFTRRLGGQDFARCLESVRSADDFAAFAAGLVPDVDADVVRRITDVAINCLGAHDAQQACQDRRLAAPITVLNAAGDDQSSIENRIAMSRWSPNICELPCDHYRLLQPEGVELLGSHVLSQLIIQTHFASAA